jgi:hypothetical protein
MRRLVHHHVQILEGIGRERQLHHLHGTKALGAEGPLRRELLPWQRDKLHQEGLLGKRGFQDPGYSLQTLSERNLERRRFQDQKQILQGLLTGFTQELLRKRGSPPQALQHHTLGLVPEILRKATDQI